MLKIKTIIELIVFYNMIKEYVMIILNEQKEILSEVVGNLKIVAGCL